MLPSSDDAWASKLTARPTSAGFGLMLNAAVGAAPAVKSRVSLDAAFVALSTATTCQRCAPSVRGATGWALQAPALHASGATSRFFAPSIQSSYRSIPAPASAPAAHLKVVLTGTLSAPAAGSVRLSPVGGVVSTLKFATAGVGSGGSGPEPSSAAPFSQTLSVCEPSLTVGRVTG